MPAPHATPDDRGRALPRVGPSCPSTSSSYAGALQSRRSRWSARFARDRPSTAPIRRGEALQPLPERRRAPRSPCRLRLPAPSRMRVSRGVDGASSNGMNLTRFAPATRTRLLQVVPVLGGRSVVEMTVGRRLAHCLLLLSVCSSCGVHKEQALSVGGSVEQASMKTYGWSSRLGLTQEIVVQLRKGTALGAVFDLSVFGPFTPGISHSDAERLGGKPGRQRVDEYGESWYVYELEGSKIEVGCQYDSSGISVTSFCNWTLHAIPKRAPEMLVREPLLVEYLRRGAQAPDRIDTRLLTVSTSDQNQTLSVYAVSRVGPSVYWFDRTRPFRREGPPPRCRSAAPPNEALQVARREYHVGEAAARPVIIRSRFAAGRRCVVRTEERS